MKDKSNTIKIKTKRTQLIHSPIERLGLWFSFTSTSKELDKNEQREGLIDPSPTSTNLQLHQVKNCANLNISSHSAYIWSRSTFWIHMLHPQRQSWTVNNRFPSNWMACQLALVVPIWRVSPLHKIVPSPMNQNPMTPTITLWGGWAHRLPNLV